MLEQQSDGSWMAVENTQYPEQIEAEVACIYREDDKLLEIRDQKADRLIGEMDLTVLMDETRVYDGQSFSLEDYELIKLSAG